MLGLTLIIYGLLLHHSVQKLARKLIHNRYEELEIIILQESNFGILNTAVESSKSRTLSKILYFEKDYYI